MSTSDATYMDVQSTATTGALGALIGFIATELPTNNLFERLLWPQRFFNHLSYSNALKIALFMPMGWPIYQGAFGALDCLYEKGLFSGNRLGHMLGTPFFGDNQLVATIHDESANLKQGQPVRNCLWIRVLGQLPVELKSFCDEEDGGPRRIVRARTSVNLLKLSHVEHEPPVESIVDHDIGKVTGKCILSIFWGRDYRYRHGNCGLHSLEVFIRHYLASATFSKAS
jgi:hypothetical protein